MKRTESFNKVIECMNVITKLSKKAKVRKKDAYELMFKLDGTREGKINHYRTYRLFADALVGTDIRDFLSCYPLRKTYDGDKWNEKDYYYSKRCVDTLLSVTDVFREEDITPFLYDVVLEEDIWKDIAVSSMMGASLYTEDKYGMDLFNAFLCYGQYEMKNRVKKPPFMKVVK